MLLHEKPISTIPSFGDSCEIDFDWVIHYAANQSWDFSEVCIYRVHTSFSHVTLDRRRQNVIYFNVAFRHVFNANSVFICPYVGLCFRAKSWAIQTVIPDKLPLFVRLSCSNKNGKKFRVNGNIGSATILKGTFLLY